ncbi:unnamed protein product, partial [marine sediment metagenome]
KQELYTLSIVMITIFFILIIYYAAIVGEKRGFYQACDSLDMVMVWGETSKYECKFEYELDKVYINERSFDIPANITGMGLLPEP